MENKIGKLLLNIFIFILMFKRLLQIENITNLTLIDQFIEQLMTDSTPDLPFWNQRQKPWCCNVWIPGTL